MSAAGQDIITQSQTSLYNLPRGKNFHLFFLFDEECYMDQLWVTTVSEELEKNGIRCADEEKNVPPGYSKYKSFQQLIDQSLIVVHVISLQSSINYVHQAKVDAFCSCHASSKAWNAIRVIPILLDPHIKPTPFRHGNLKHVVGYGRNSISHVVEILKKATTDEILRPVTAVSDCTRQCNMTALGYIRNPCCLLSQLHEKGIKLANKTVSINWSIFEKYLFQNYSIVSKLVHLRQMLKIDHFKVLLSSEAKMKFRKYDNTKPDLQNLFVNFIQDTLNLDFSGEFYGCTFRHRLNGKIEDRERLSLINISQQIHINEFKEYSKNYKSLESRRSTYIDAPDCVKDKSEVLAKAGFIYTGSNEFFVLCPFCNTARFKYGKQTEDEFDVDSLLRYHFKWSKDCQFLKNIRFGPTSEISSVAKTMDHVLGMDEVGYASVYDDVLKYNSDGLSGLNFDISATKLTDMGFLFRFTAPEPYKICVICYSCSVTLSEFCNERELLNEHIKWSHGKCKHLQSTSGANVMELYDKMVEENEKHICSEFVIEIMLLRNQGGSQKDEASLTYATEGTSLRHEAFDVIGIDQHVCSRGAYIYGIETNEAYACSSENHHIELSLKQDILAFQPVLASVEAVNILLLGPMSSGKSSFINSVCSVFKERICYPAPVGKAPEGLTEKPKTYKMWCKRRESLNLRLLDTIGLKSSMTEFIQSDSFQGYNLNSKTVNERDVQPENLVHSVGFVINTSKMTELDDNINSQLKTLNLDMKKRGYQPVFIMTHYDKVENHWKDNVQDTTSSSSLDRMKSHVAETYGSPKNLVYQIKNYENETNLDPSTNCMILLALQKLLQASEDFLEHLVDSQNLNKS